MKMSRRILVTIILLLLGRIDEAEEYACPSGGDGTSPPQTMQVLLPLATHGVRGAFGSVWYTELWAANTTDLPIIYYFAPCNVACCCDEFNTLAPQSVNLVQLEHRNGILLCLPPHGSIQLQNRIHRIDEPPGSSGVAVPVVRTDEFGSGEANLFGLSIDSTNRVTLRLYALEADTWLRVDLIGNEGTVIRTSEVLLSAPETTYNFRAPGYAQVSILPIGSEASPVRIRVRPLTAGRRFWAFASVTNNESSQVTIIPPAW